MIIFDISTMSSSALLHQTLILIFAVCATALPVSSSTNDPSATKDTWSKEAILGLVAILITITIFCISLATSRLRKWIANPFKCMLTNSRIYHTVSQADYSCIAGCKSNGRRQRPVVGGGRDSSTQLLRRRAEEWLEFNEWRSLVESRALS
jgi:hypothetical protein